MWERNNGDENNALQIVYRLSYDRRAKSED
jgi:hypothetical protein